MSTLAKSILDCPEPELDNFCADLTVDLDLYLLKGDEYVDLPPDFLMKEVLLWAKRELHKTNTKGAGLT